MGYERVPMNGVDRLVVRLVYAQQAPVVGKLARLLLMLLGVDMPGSVRLGPRLRLPHSTTPRVIHATTRIGADVTIFQGVTIGRADIWNDAHTSTGVVVGDDVILCAGAVVLFRDGQDVHIGDGAIIGANAVITRDVPPRSIMAGNPARAVRQVPA